MLKTALVLSLGMLAARLAFAWSGTGPLLGFQTGALDYGAARPYYPFPAGGELGGPQSFNVCARLNVGVITYAYDETFLEYFGPAGVAAVDAAMNVFNALPKMTDSTSLAGYLTQGNQRLNYTAQALQLMDLKSATMGLIIERMGLLGETHVYDLISRVPASPGQYQYTMIMRNFDPDTSLPSPYVNGHLYGFQIYDDGTTADAIEDGLDATVLPLAATAVATRESLNLGGYYLGLTRDDVGGLRALYKRSRFENETLDGSCYVSSNYFTSPWSPTITTNAATAAGTVTTGVGGTVTTTTTTTTATTAGFTGILGGVGKITFAKVEYNSGIGNTFGTNVCEFTIPMLTNGVISNMVVFRTNTAPDLIFAAADLNTYAYPLVTPLYTRAMTFTAPPADPAGGLIPSTIVENAGVGAGLVITFNSAGPVYYNLYPTTLAQDGFVQTWNWGSYSSGTNVIVYPQQPGTITSLVEAAVSGTLTAPTLDAFDPAGTNEPVATEPIIMQE